MDECWIEFSSTYESGSRARHALVNFARSAGLAGDTLDDFESAVGEALANAVEHGHRDGSRFSVRANLVDGALQIDVKDGGRGFAGWNATECVKPISSSPRGFGTFIMRTLMDRIEYTEGGTCIRLTKKLTAVTTDENEQQEA